MENRLVIVGAVLNVRRMCFRILCCVLAGALFAGCQAPYKKADAADKKPLKDVAGDQSFQGFVGRLRIAAAKKDLPALASMMTSDFGYRWETPPSGENAFTYWDEHGVWPELRAVLKENFVPNERYMVAPPQVAGDPNYNGYRAGLRQVNGSWKFAYFVPGEGAR